MNRVFVTGVGTVCALGTGRGALEEGLRKGASAVRSIRSFDCNGARVSIAAEAQGFEASRFVPDRIRLRSGRFAHFAIAAARLAIADARLRESEVAGPSTGVVIASNLGGTDDRERWYETFRDSGPERLSPFIYSSTANAMASAWVSILLGAEGPGYCLANSSASGNQAIGLASRLIRWGEAEVVLAGAAEAPITPFLLAALDANGVLSRRNDDPARAFRPFDRNRDGMCVGEGAAVLVLETERHALERGARAAVEIAGYGAAMEAHHPYHLAPDARGAREAIGRALADARCRPGDVKYVNAHGTATRGNDAYEARILEEIFGGGAAVSSTKPLTGHLLGAAGAIEGAICVVSLESEFLPATPNLDDPEPAGKLDLIRGQGRPAAAELALNLSWGFGGYSSALLLRRVA